MELYIKGFFFLRNGGSIFEIVSKRDENMLWYEVYNVDSNEDDDVCEMDKGVCVCRVFMVGGELVDL